MDLSLINQVVRMNSMSYPIITNMDVLDALKQFRDAEKAEAEFKEELATTFSIHEQLKSRRLAAKETLTLISEEYFMTHPENKLMDEGLGSIVLDPFFEFNITNYKNLLLSLLNHCENNNDNIEKYIRFNLIELKELIKIYGSVSNSPLFTNILQDGKKMGDGYEFIPRNKISIRSR